MGKIEEDEAVEIGNDLLILKLAVTAVELKRKLSTDEIRETPSLGKALSALEAVLEEMGWANSVASDCDSISGSPIAEI